MRERAGLGLFRFAAHAENLLKIENRRLFIYVPAVFYMPAQCLCHSGNGAAAADVHENAMEPEAAGPVLFNDQEFPCFGVT